MKEIIFFPNDETFIQIQIEERECISCKQEKICMIIGEPPTEKFCGFQICKECISDIFRKE